MLYARFHTFLAYCFAIKIVIARLIGGFAVLVRCFGWTEINVSWLSSIRKIETLMLLIALMVILFVGFISFMTSLRGLMGALNFLLVVMEGLMRFAL